VRLTPALRKEDELGLLSSDHHVRGRGTTKRTSVKTPSIQKK